ncbi:hypothetical protein SCLCIDRAFT_100846, partial [Scleroderma citrinum Foug A]
WNKLDQILQLDARGLSALAHAVGPSSISNIAKSPALSSWADAWYVYEDVCLVCTSLWIGSWHSNSTQLYSTLNADSSRANGRKLHFGGNNLTINGPVVKSVGLGIKG